MLCLSLPVVLSLYLSVPLPVCPSLQTAVLNKHLSSLMDGLTAKVFRTFNASITLQQQLKELTSRKHPPMIPSLAAAHRSSFQSCSETYLQA